MLVQVDGKDSGTVVDALIGQIRRLPNRLMSSLTWDRGTELAHHTRLTVATDVAVYFYDPRSPWQRGSNENTNGLLRQYGEFNWSSQHLGKECWDGRSAQVR